MKRIIRLLALSVLGILHFESTASAVQLAPLTSFGTNGNGTIQTGERGYLNTGNVNRGMAFNPATGHVLVVHRDPVGNNWSIHILDGTSGEDLGTLDTSSLVLAGNTDFLLSLIAVAEDGAIYVGNLSTSATPGQYVLYRWENEASLQALVYIGDPSNGNANNINRRWGDTMTVRGAGTSTQVLLGTQSGTVAAILSPTDDTMATFAATTLQSDAPAGELGYGTAFGAGDTFWAKGASADSSPLHRFSFDLNAGTATRLETFSVGEFPSRIGPLTINVASNLLVGIESIPENDRVRIYDISSPGIAPVLLDWSNFSSNVANNIFAGSVAFGSNSSGAATLYALNNNNGLMAFSLVASNHFLPPTIFLQLPNEQYSTIGSDVTLAVAADGVPAPDYFQWYFNETNAIAGATNTTYVLTNAQATEAGWYSLVASNVFGAVTSSPGNVILVNAAGGLVAQDLFDYAPDQLLTAANPTDWTLFGAGTDDTYVTAGGLNIPGLAPATGNSITNGGSGPGMRFGLPTTIFEGSVYYSFALRVDSLGAFTSTTSFIAAFVDPAGSSTYQARLMPRPAAQPGQYNLGVTKVTAGQAVWATNDFNEGEVLFIIARYTFNSADTTDDQVDLWINPDPATFGTEPPATPTLTANLAGNDIPLISQFTFRQNTAANTPAAITYDELRIGRTWASVTPTGSTAAPELTAIRNGTQIVLTWPTNNSDGFELESISDFDDPNGWELADEPVLVQGANKTVTVDIAAGNRMFRLKK